MIYRGSGFLATAWFGSSSTHSLPPLVSKVDRQLTARLRKRDKGEGRRRGRSQIMRWRESLVLYKSFDTLCSIPSKMRGRRWGRSQIMQRRESLVLNNSRWDKYFRLRLLLWLKNHEHFVKYLEKIFYIVVIKRKNLQRKTIIKKQSIENNSFICKWMNSVRSA